MPMTVRDVDFRVTFRWNVNTIPGSGGTFTDETSRVLGVSGALELVPPNEAFQGGRQVVQKCTVRLANEDFRYSLWNTAGPLYAYLSDYGGYGVKAQIEVQIDSGAWVVIYTGYVKRIDEQFANNQVTITLNDIGEFLRQRKSSVIYRCLKEHDAVITLLGLVGLSEGAHFFDWDSATPTIDWSTMTVDFLWLDDESVWDELVELSNASGARIYVGPGGAVRFEKSYHWVISDAGPDETLTIERIGDWSPQLDDRAFFDEIIVDYTERLLGDPNTEVWTQDSAKLINPGKKEEFVARFTLPVVSVKALDPATDFGVTTVDGTDVSAIRPMVLAHTYANSADVELDNTAFTDMAVLTQGSIKGQPIVGRPSQEVKKKTTNERFGRKLEIRGNPYVQTQLQAEAIRDFLVWWYNLVKMTITISKVAGDPERQLGRKILLEVPNANGIGHTDVSVVVIRVGFDIRVTQTGAISYHQELGCIENVFETPGGYFLIETTPSYGTAKLWL